MNNRINSVKNELTLQKKPWLEEAVHSVFAASDAFESYVNAKHYDYGVTQRGIALLHTIVLNNGKLSQKRIPKLLNRTKQAVAQVLANLEKRQLVVRETIGQDRRRRLVRITEEGLRIAKECLPLREQFYDCVQSCVSQSDAERLVSILKTLSTRLIADMNKSSKLKNSKTS
jgi:DNA-binding MarR family transcriptional regulator